MKRKTNRRVVFAKKFGYKPINVYDNARKQSHTQKCIKVALYDTGWLEMEMYKIARKQKQSAVSPFPLNSVVKIKIEKLCKLTKMSNNRRLTMSESRLSKANKIRKALGFLMEPEPENVDIFENSTVPLEGSDVEAEAAAVPVLEVAGAGGLVPYPMIGPGESRGRK